MEHRIRFIRRERGDFPMMDKSKIVARRRDNSHVRLFTTATGGASVPVTEGRPRAIRPRLSLSKS